MAFRTCAVQAEWIRDFTKRKRSLHFDSPGLKTTIELLKWLLSPCNSARNSEACGPIPTAGPPPVNPFSYVDPEWAPLHWAGRSLLWKAMSVYLKANQKNPSRT